MDVIVYAMLWVIIQVVINLNLVMSSKFSNTGTGFSTSSLQKQQQYIKQVVQNEVLLIFEDIKIQIQAKIKSIDRNIYDLRNQVKKMYENCRVAQLAEFFYKVQKIEADVQVLKYSQQTQLKTSRTKSLDKERKPIFKKDGEKYDFSSVILGLQSQKVLKSEIKAADKIQYTKPPLPRQNNKIFKNDYSLASPVQDYSVVKRNPILQESGSIHKWLNDNNNRESSCFSAIIKEEQIEQSVYF